jgi:hypothetical protein
MRLLLAFPDTRSRAVLVHVVTAWHPRTHCCFANTADEAVDLVCQDAWTAVVATEPLDAGEATAATRGLATAYIDLVTLDPLLAVLQRYDERSPRPASRQTTAAFEEAALPPRAVSRNRRVEGHPRVT